MLVLSRRLHQSVIITVPPSTVAQRVEVQVVEIDGRAVRLGFNAAPEVAVNRQEIQDELDAKAKAAGATQP